MLGSLEPIVQKDIADCAIASLAMIIGVPYRDVSERALLVCTKPHKHGMWETEITKVARNFGVTFKKAASPEDTTGLLVVVRGKGRSSECHITALFQGIVVNPADGLLWDLDTYLAQGRWSIAAVLERVT